VKFCFSGLITEDRFNVFSSVIIIVTFSRGVGVDVEVDTAATVDSDTSGIGVVDVGVVSVVVDELVGAAVE